MQSYRVALTIRCATTTSITSAIHYLLVKCHMSEPRCQETSPRIAPGRRRAPIPRRSSHVTSAVAQIDIDSYERALAVIAKHYPLDRFPRKTLYALEEMLSSA